MVYSYTPAENAALKVLASLCYRYDGLMPSNLYSFRRDISAKTALRRIISAPDISEMYAYKLDISNYFNSIDIPLLLSELRPLLADDEPLLRFFSDMLLTDAAMSEGELIHEPHGVMAGVPTSAFLANVCLLPLDRYFEQRGVLYARYSDDIIIFAGTRAELEEHMAHIHKVLAEHKLEINHEKEAVLAPHEKWTFLGVSYLDGCIDISQNTKAKLKGKIRRKARALYRWRLRKGVDGERAARAFLRCVNRKLYLDSDDSRHFSWVKWFFPLITTSEGLKELDDYIQQHARYVVSGCFSRANYRVKYETLKEWGFRPLVHEYYKLMSDR